MNVNEEVVEQELEIISRIPQSDGFEVINAATAYINLQEVTTADIICFQKWIDLSATKRKNKLMSPTNNNII